MTPADRRVDEAAEQCRAAGGTWSPARERIYRLLLETDTPRGAYDLIDRLSSPGRPVGPPTVYRVLDFLMRIGLVHRIARTNTFVACAAPGEPHTATFLLCQHCRRVVELPPPPGWRELGADRGFVTHSIACEIEGRCPDCRAREETH